MNVGELKALLDKYPDGENIYVQHRNIWDAENKDYEEDFEIDVMNLNRWDHPNWRALITAGKSYSNDEYKDLLDKTNDDKVFPALIIRYYD